MLSKVIVALAMLTGAAASIGRVQMEPDVTVVGTAPSWTQGSRVTKADTIRLPFWLKHDKEALAAFHNELVELATPTSAKYGKWLTRDQVVDRLAPADAAIETVTKFVLENGAYDIHLNKMRDVVSVEVPAEVAEEMLGTKLYHYHHNGYGDVDIIRAGSAYSLPVEVAGSVSVVGDLLRFPRLKEKLKVMNETEAAAPVDGASSEWSACGAAYSAYNNPSVLAEAYGFEFPFTGAQSSNSMAVAEFQNQYYDDTDLEAFSSQCGLSSTVTVSTTVGGNNEARCSIGLEPCVESLLDIEYAGAIAGDIPLSVYYSGTYSLLDWAETLQDQDDCELVHSVSYGNDEVQQTSSAYMESVNTAFMSVGAQGISILFAAGDQGVWGRTGYSATGTFNPDFPAGSPYVTAVGGTDFSTKSTIGSETAWADGGSGFSDEFAQPSWQSDEVSGYFSSGVSLPASRLYNADGRGYPDVSALAGQVNPYFISFKEGKFSAVAGTSAACPVVSAIFAQLNDARLAAGKSSLGWLNPFIYEVGTSAFNDVTTGTTDGGYSSGFTATAGWDPATGFGTPDFAALKSAAVSY